MIRRPRVRTLRTRVSLLALGVIAAWLVILAVALDLVLVVRLSHQVDDTLRVRAQATSATVVVQDGSITGVRDSATDSRLDSSIWVYGRTAAVARPSGGPRFQHLADELDGSPGRFVDRYDHRFYVLPVDAGGRRVGTIVAAADLDPYERTRTLALVGLGVVALLLLLGAYPVLRFATGRALRPVDQMTRQAAEWGVVAPDARFGHDQRYAELASLARSLDELLGRVSSVLRHERHVSAELSHELRTPLARVTAQVELMADAATAAQQRDLDAIRANCAAMAAIIDTLMTAARSELGAAVGRASLADVLAAFADPGGRPAVQVDARGLAVEVDGALVTRMLAPVVDNARRFAATSIEVDAHRTGDEVRIDVINDGPRLPDELREQIFEPGFTTRDAGHDGVGLGLALARRLARAADGELEVVAGNERTTFRLSLPAG